MDVTDSVDWWNTGDIASYFSSKDPNERLLQWLNEAVLPRPTSVIDMGCGHGRNLSIFPDSTRVAGFDPSPGSVSFTQNRSDLPQNASIKIGCLPHHPFFGEHFDLVIADGVIHQLTCEQEWQQSLTAICDAVRPKGGWLFLSLFVSDIAPGKYQSSDGSVWTASGQPPMRLSESAVVFERLNVADGTLIRSVLEEFNLPSGTRMNLTVLSRFN